MNKESNIVSEEDIKKYYDENIHNKLKGFVYGNSRVERAWLTIVEYGGSPKQILEIGCGIGDISWRMSKHWKESNVLGIDISPKSIEVANKLFSSPNVSFRNGIVKKGTVTGKFDLIVLMDVYEHIEINERSALHEAIRDLVSEEGRIILSFPTPRKLAALRNNIPEGIQPIDEDVTIMDIVRLGRDVHKEIFIYKEVSIWNSGDYAHAVLGSRLGWRPESDSPIFGKKNINSKSLNFINRLKQKIGKILKVSWLDSRVGKIKIIQEKLDKNLFVD